MKKASAVSFGNAEKTISELPSRFPRYWPVSVAVLFIGIMLSLHALVTTEFIDLSLVNIIELPVNGGRLVNEMFPPDFSILPRLVPAIFETLQMSLVGTVVGVVVSLPLAVLAARNISPHAMFYYASRMVIALARSVPDLVWAIFFVILVGLGPLAGALTLFVDTIGFAGRFFAEAMEEVDPAPSEALRALGARAGGLLFSVTLPAVIPSFINTSLYSLERAVQSSVVLGLVGAGGIGMLLEEPMTWHNYDQAATVVLVIFLLLILVERISSAYRSRIIQGRR